jgi:hypothetical protein
LTGRTANSIDSLTGQTIQHFFFERPFCFHLLNAKVVDHGAWVPVGVQVVIGSWEWPFSSPELVQYGREVVGIRSYSCIKNGNWDVSDLQFLPGLFLISLEYFVE